MKKVLWAALCALYFAFPGCGSREVNITLVQANDVYEMTPVNGGRYGGLARLQTLVKQLKRENPHTYTLLAGDLLSPSAIGTAKVNGERLNGKQMVAVLNAMGWDYMTLGNHEFDNGRASLLGRSADQGPNSRHGAPREAKRRYRAAVNAPGHEE
jgi:5'-nucleotidase/UDP-sugar diphosphatase